MSQKCIFYQRIDDIKAIVIGIHYMPFDSENGLTQEQISQGILVDDVPEPDSVMLATKKATLYVNPQTKEMWYEYYDRPLTPEEQALEQNEKLDLLIMMMLEKEGII